MPVLSTHVFVNHKGGVGKSTLCFHLATAYAKKHPEEKVLVLDFTEVGDVSELLLGGIHSQRGKRRQNAIAPIANSTNYLLKALAQAIPRFHLTEHLQEDEKVLGALLESMPQLRESGGTSAQPGPFSQEITNSQQAAEESGQLSSSEGAPMVSIERFALPVSKVNARLPENLFLCPSGGETVEPIRFSESQRKEICEVLNKSYEAVEGTWKLFIDTDSDKHSSPYRDIALGIADYAIVPLHADVTDFYRVKDLMLHMCGLKKEGLCKARVQQILWNQLMGRFNRDLELEEGLAKSPFIPLKAEQDMIATLDKLFYDLGKEYPELFVLAPGPNLDLKQFATLTSVCVRHFGTVNVASKDTGVPIPVLQPGIVHGNYIQYGLLASTVAHRQEELEKIVEGLIMSPEGDERQQAEEAVKQSHKQEPEEEQDEENYNLRSHDQEQKEDQDEKEYNLRSHDQEQVEDQSEKEYDLRSSKQEQEGEQDEEMYNLRSRVVNGGEPEIELEGPYEQRRSENGGIKRGAESSEGGPDAKRQHGTRNGG